MGLSERQVKRLEIIESLSPPQAEYVVDLGTEDGLIGKLARRLYPMAWIEGCDIFDETARGMPDAYDLFDKRGAREFVSMTYDTEALIYCCELLEHLPKEEGKALKQACLDTGATCIFTTPIGFMPQDAIKGNPYQKHVSAWDWDDFHDAHVVIEDPKHSILAALYRSTV